MTDDDWIAWHGHHTTVFGFRFKEDLAMVSSWRNFLDGYSVAELQAATVELAKDPPAFREPHISGLLRCLASKRAESYARMIDGQGRHDDLATADRCGVCDATGWVMVPHAACMVGGEFVHGPGGRKNTMVVACDCYVGRRKRATFDASPKPPMTLPTYEAKYGHGWKGLLEDWEAEKYRERQLRRSATAIDKQHGPLANDLRTVQGRTK